MSQANIDKLKKAGLVEEPLTPDERQKLDQLTDQETDALISVQGKLDGKPVKRDRLKPLCF